MVVLDFKYRGLRRLSPSQVLQLKRCIAYCCVLLDTRGVFKARKPCDETRDAEEVKDSDETVRDIPIDLQDAVTVEVHVTWVNVMLTESRNVVQ